MILLGDHRSHSRSSNPIKEITSETAEADALSEQELFGDLLLDFGVEVVAVRKRTVDPGITQHLAPNR